MLARVYSELGFMGPQDVEWNERVNAGLESREVVLLNMSLLQELKGTFLAPRGPIPYRWAGTLLDHLRASTETTVRSSAVEMGTRILDRTEYHKRRFNGLRWDRVETIAQKYRQPLLDLATRSTVVKDPQFTWTLPIWLAAGVRPNAVIACLRAIPAMVQSRIDAQMMRAPGAKSAEDNFFYGIGILTTAATVANIPFVPLNFPQFLDDPDRLYALLPMPEARSLEQFIAVFDRVVNRDLIHHR